ncbi:RAB10 protein, partial [Hypocryptadius cinnamomeus]|nr:RAB10 protein [Hypocryptadius cinnamomeus]
MLLGNKCDMEDKRVVPKAKGEQVSVKQKLLYPSQQITAKTSACSRGLGCPSGTPVKEPNSENVDISSGGGVTGWKSKCC